MFRRLVVGTLLGGLLAFGAGAAGFSTAVASASPAPVTVGMICSCTGPAGAAFAPIAEAFQAWVNTTNKAGGIQGHHIQFTNMNDQTSPSVAGSDAQKLISANVNALIDMSLLDETWLPKAQAANIPVIGQYAFDPINPLVFVPGTSLQFGGDSVAALAKQAKATSIAQVTCAELATCTAGLSQLKAAVGKTSDVKIVYTATVSLTAVNYTPQCLAAKAAHATSLDVGGAPANIETMATDCTQQGFKPIYLTTGTAWSPSFESTPGLKANSWLSFSLYPYFNSKQPQIAALNKAMNKYYPGSLTNKNTPTGQIEQMWASGTMLSAALKAGGLTTSNHPTSAMVLKGLYTFKKNTLGGLTPPLTFKKGQIHLVNCWYTGHFQNGKETVLNGGKSTCASGSGSSS